MTLPVYATGTVSVDHLGTVVSGTGGMWSGINAREGDFFTRSDGTAVITEVTDPNHLKITPWPGATVVGGDYAIEQNYVGRVVGVAAAEDVGVMLEKLHTDGLPFIVGSGESVPDPSYGDEGQLAFKPSTGEWWEKTGGAWVPSAGLTALGYGGTSSTSLLIGLSPPPKVFTTQTNLAYNGARVRAASAANLNNFMEGPASYSGTTLTMTCDTIGGSGTHADWLFSVAGAQGPAGPPGPTGGNFADAPNDAKLYGRKSATPGGALAWAQVIPGGAIVSDTPPAGVADGTLWWESDSGILYVRCNDGNSTQWVAIAFNGGSGGGGGPAPAAALPLMDGTAAVGASLLYAREDHRHPTDTSLAPLASPSFTGNPTGPTKTVGDNSVSLATTAFVFTAVGGVSGGGGVPSSVNPVMDGVASPGSATAYSRGDHVHPSDTTKADKTYVDSQDALKAPLASPTFTGTPAAPTPTAGDSSTKIATTAFVTSVDLTKVSKVISRALSSGTYTPTAGMIYCIVECLGGGGGGGGSIGSSGNFNCGSGGAGACYSRKTLSAATVGASQTVTVGAGGNGFSGNNGGTGGTSSFGSLCTAPGGQGGQYCQTGIQASPGALGGPSGVGDMSCIGGTGGTSWNATNAGALYTGIGGTSYFGGSGGCGYDSNGTAGAVGGGGGGGMSPGPGSHAGGAGGSGFVVITEFCTG